MYTGLGDDRAARARHLRHRRARHGAVGPASARSRASPAGSCSAARCNPVITPYASLLPEGDDLDTYTRVLVERAVKAKELGFSAVKLEICIKGPYSHNSLQIEDDREIARIVAACRKAIGPEMTVMVDVAYCWRDWKEALRAIEMFADEDIYFIETPLPSDDVDGYAKLVPGVAGAGRRRRMAEYALRVPGASSVPDALDVVQPDVGRVGGLTEARRVAHACARPRPARRAALLEIGDRHRRLGASGGRVADLHATSSSCRANSPIPG